MQICDDNTTENDQELQQINANLKITYFLIEMQIITGFDHICCTVSKIQKNFKYNDFMIYIGNIYFHRAVDRLCVIFRSFICASTFAKLLKMTEPCAGRKLGNKDLVEQSQMMPLYYPFIYETYRSPTIYSVYIMYTKCLVYITFIIYWLYTNILIYILLHVEKSRI